jgi:hypothetical protein
METIGPVKPPVKRPLARAVKDNISGHLKPGSNEIKVEVVNTWNNRIVGDLRNPDETAYTRTNVKNKFNERSPLLPSGLMGKAEIFFLTPHHK